MSRRNASNALAAAQNFAARLAQQAISDTDRQQAETKRAFQFLSDTGRMQDFVLQCAYIHPDFSGILVQPCSAASAPTRRYFFSFFILFCLFCS